MNTLLFLDASDFELNGNSLFCAKATSLTIIFFYSTNCPHCGPAREHFNMAASQFMQGNCKFGMINVTTNSRVPQLASNSTTPIKHVPFIMAFFNRTPLAIFSSNVTLQNLIRFVQQCYASIKDQVNTFGAVKQEAEIPAYTTGIPFCDENVCYLNYDAAYRK